MNEEEYQERRQKLMQEFSDKMLKTHLLAEEMDWDDVIKCMAYNEHMSQLQDSIAKLNAEYDVQDV